MDSTKPWQESKTVWGGIVTVVCSGLAVVGKSIDTNTQLFLTDAVYQIALAAGAVIGGILAIVGRFKADSTVKK